MKQVDESRHGPVEPTGIRVSGIALSRAALTNLRSKPMTTSKAQQTFKLKTLFMGSLGTIPESYARKTEKKQLTAWIAEGLIEHRAPEKIYALTPKGEKRIR